MEHQDQISAPASFVRHSPAAPLNRYIACLWWSRRDTPQHYCEHILPSGGVQLLFTLHDTPIRCLPGNSPSGQIVWTHSVVHGPQRNHYVAGPKPPGAVVGVAFHPGAAASVLGVSMVELAGHHVTLPTIWGRRGTDLHQKIRAAAAPTEIFRILEEDFSAGLQRSLLVHPAIADALLPHTSIVPTRVRDIQCASGYSPKHFIALFRTAVGLTPKHYYRIQRFNSVLRHLAGAERSNLADVAAALGYSDQAHLTRDFREFAGITPCGYRPQSAHGHLHHRASAADRP